MKPDVDPLTIMNQVRKQIDTYDYGRRVEVEGLVGTALPNERIDQGLQEFRQALVEPRWLDVNMQDTPAQRLVPVVERCLIVADDGRNSLLAYVPSESKFTVVREFRPGEYGSFGVDGDAVGAFLSR